MNAAREIELIHSLPRPRLEGEISQIAGFVQGETSDRVSQGLNDGGAEAGSHLGKSARKVGLFGRVAGKIEKLLTSAVGDVDVFPSLIARHGAKPVRTWRADISEEHFTPWHLFRQCAQNVNPVAQVRVACAGRR